MMTDQIDEDDPHDDITDRLGNLPKASTDSTKRPAQRDTGRPEQSDIQRKEPPVEEGR